MVHVLCSCGTVFNRKEKTRSNMGWVFRNSGPHRGHHEVARWTFNPPANIKGMVSQ